MNVTLRERRHYTVKRAVMQELDERLPRVLLHREAGAKAGQIDERAMRLYLLSRLADSLTRRILDALENPLSDEEVIGLMGTYLPGHDDAPRWPPELGSVEEAGDDVLNEENLGKAIDTLVDQLPDTRASVIDFAAVRKNREKGEKE